MDRPEVCQVQTGSGEQGKKRKKTGWDTVWRLCVVILAIHLCFYVVIPFADCVWLFCQFINAVEVPFCCFYVIIPLADCVWLFYHLINAVEVPLLQFLSCHTAWRLSVVVLSIHWCNRNTILLRIWSPYVAVICVGYLPMKSTNRLAHGVMYTSATHAGLIHDVIDRLSDTKWQRSARAVFSRLSKVGGGGCFLTVYSLNQQ